jgi:hypothetical protein
MCLIFLLIALTLFAGIAFFGLPSAFSQAPATEPATIPAAELPRAPEPAFGALASSSQQSQAGQSSSRRYQSQASQSQAQDSGSAAKHKPPPHPKRILGLMPNYRAVSAGVLPPPPTPREAFKIATENSFDYSAFVFVGITSLLAEGTNAHPQLGKGVGGYWAYSWRGYLDKTDGNYWVDAIMPTVFHQDERYYAMGEGGILKRGVYAATRVIVTPNDHGKSSFNAAEILGRGVSQAISLAYYPSQTQSFSGFSQKYAYAVGRDALTNVSREFWPDIDAHLIHRRHSSTAAGV